MSSARYPRFTFRAGIERGFVVCAVALSMSTQAVGADPPQFGAGERRRILDHGPWPAAATRDPGNRVSGDPDAIDLGRRLFSDSALSRSGYIGCVTCHQPDRALTDLRARAHGIADVDRNTPTLANLRLQRWYGWGGSSDSLWMASIRPLLDPRELDSDVAVVVRRFSLNDDLTCRYRKVFGRAPDRADNALLANVGKALAAFGETLVTGRTPFDGFRDALERDDRVAMRRYPVAAQRGLKLFVGRGNCFTCHAGPNFSDGEFHDTGVPPVVGSREVDTGREDGKFRTPSLRNVAVTPPYMHNGSLDTLREVLLHYSRLDAERLQGASKEILRKLSLTKGETGDLVAFLQTLTDALGERRTLPPIDPSPCN